MQYICQTAIVSYHKDANNPNRMHRVVGGKVTIPCQSKREACDMADMFVLSPDRIAFAGVQYYTEGGEKLLLSFNDLNQLASLANEEFSAESFPSNLKAVR